MTEPKPRVGWGLLAVGWVAAAAIINPAGDCPLNDDWAYGRESLNVVLLAAMVGLGIAGTHDPL